MDTVERDFWILRVRCQGSFKPDSHYIYVVPSSHFPNSFLLSFIPAFPQLLFHFCILAARCLDPISLRSEMNISSSLSARLQAPYWGQPWDELKSRAPVHLWGAHELCRDEHISGPTIIAKQINCNSYFCSPGGRCIVSRQSATPLQRRICALPQTERKVINLSGKERWKRG